MRNPLAVAVAKSTGRVGAVYAGAQVTRLTDDWLVSVLSADMTIKNDLMLLKQRSRQLCRDNPHMAGWLDTLVDQVVGWEPDGIRMQARVRGAGGKFDKALNTSIESAFRRWSEATTCSADAQANFGDHQRMLVRTQAQDGEALFEILDGFDNEFGFAVRQIDSDLLDERLNIAPSPTQNEIRMGVEIDRYGRPLFYHLWTRHPTDPGFDRQRIPVPASRIIHRFLQLRPGQTRGVPWTTPVLIAMKMLDGFTESEVMQSRIAASAGGFFTMTGDDAASFGDAYQQPTGEDGDKPQRLTMDMEPGLARQLPPGLKWEPWNPTHPNANFAAFQKAMLRTVGRGIKMAYTTFAGDLEGVNYGSMRGGNLAERDGYRLLQRQVTTTFGTPVYRRWLRMASLYGALKLPSLDTAASSDHKWEYRGWPWIDPKNDIETGNLEVALGVNSRQRICAETGRDYEEILDELAEEQKLAKAAGVDITPIVRTTVGGAGPGGEPDTTKGAAVPGNGNGNGTKPGGRIAGLLPLSGVPS